MLKYTKNKVCFITGCSNTSVDNPEKIFLTVPRNMERRKQWFQAAGRTDTPTISPYYCCEDHFNLEEDAENWIYFKLMGGRLFLKDDAMPTIKPERPVVASQLSPSSREQREQTLKMMEASKLQNEQFVNEIDPTNIIFIQNMHENTQNVMPGTAHLVENATINSNEALAEEPPRKKVKIRRKTPKKKSRGTNTFDKPIRMEHQGVLVRPEVRNVCIGTYDKGKSISCKAENILMPSLASVSSVNEDIAQKLELYKLKQHSSLFLGIPKVEIILIDRLQEITKQSIRDIFLVLKKIKTDDSFQRLGIDFGVKAEVATKFFCDTLLIMAKNLKPLVLWPQNHRVDKLLAIKRRSPLYKSAQTIIDCFELELETPKECCVKNYKFSKAVKFLISSTSDGILNFISSGFAGNVSNFELLEKSGYLETMPKIFSIVIDNGFKEVIRKKVKVVRLVRPLDFSEFSKKNRIDGNKVKSNVVLKTNVERLIRRFREFQMLSSHTNINEATVPLLDYVIIVVGGIINMQRLLNKRK